MAWTEDDLNELKSAIATGARVVQFKDKRVEYQPLDDMLRTKRIIEEEIGKAKPSSKRRFAHFSRGLD